VGFGENPESSIIFGTSVAPNRNNDLGTKYEITFEKMKL
jgi:hypothetical protein